MTTEPEAPIEPIPLPPGDAYALLSKPTAQLTPAEIHAICCDLRAKRIKFLEGKADKPVARKAASTVDNSPEAKAARTEALRESLLGSLEL
jgi:hypothetical protein